MTTQEAVSHYFEKKQSGELTKNEIRQTLEVEHNFSKEQIVIILHEISDLELEAIQRKGYRLNALIESVYFSYFFVLFSIAAIVVSIFLLQKETKTELSKYLPWVIIAGAVFIMGKHIAIIYQKSKKTS